MGGPAFKYRGRRPGDRAQWPTSGTTFGGQSHDHMGSELRFTEEGRFYLCLDVDEPDVAPPPSARKSSARSQRIAGRSRLHVAFGLA